MDTKDYIQIGKVQVKNIRIQRCLNDAHPESEGKSRGIEARKSVSQEIGTGIPGAMVDSAEGNCRRPEH